MENMRELAEEAVELAKIFGVELDYSPASVFTLDKMVQTIHEMHSEAPLPEQALDNTAYMLGAYLGETLLRTGLADRGFAWADTEEGETALGREDTCFFPVTKAWKRVTAGSGDDLGTFYGVALVMSGVRSVPAVTC